ncbi:SusC/RagA family TonB-linked outer membrane protein [Pedobacter polaris]|uniref:SusC/RagA family TonB-linked outer membrane protein n=1 Tax=Pedobacter polaris TaxID=2571273 RepID=A0A4U1CSY8_9SPHI|nr:SusC/RagA family TonB-linked outer membrane protein [Pedobacter polaris]TKC10666.1 SusC/RagA family TonB-linked outer membrane protein [Pedobacter polaris]
MKKYILLMLMCIGIISTKAQTLKGKVIEAGTSKPLQNINIKIDKLNISAITNEQGDFTFALKKGEALLEITGIGYLSQIKIISSPYNGLLTIELVPAINQLEEVIVNTGYQKIAKERATGSFSHISNETFNQQISTDVMSRLEGVAPALSVDRRTLSGSIMVRGLSTLTGDRSPLIILDEFPYAGDITNINPNDVETVTILKDAAAASIWGAKAGNGVIVITTKKGSYNKKIQINVNASTSIIEKPNLNEYNNVSAAEYVDLEKFLFSKGYYTSQENSTAKIPLSPAVELMISARDGKITQEQLQVQLAFLKTQDIKNNYSNSFFKQAFNNQYNVSLKGGGSNMSWYVFTGYDQNKSALGADYSRLNLKLDNTIKLTNKLEIGISLLLGKISSKSGRTSFSSITTNNGSLPPYTQFVDDLGNPLAVMKTYRSSFVSTLGGGNLLDWNYYPLTDGINMPSTSAKLDILSNLRLSYTLLKGLKLSLNYQYEKENTNSNLVYGLDSYYTRNLINQFTQIAGTVTRPVPLGSIRNDNLNVLTVNNIRGQLNYDHQWKDINLSVLGGGELREARTTGNGSTTYGIDENTLRNVSVDNVNPYKSIVTGSNIYIPYNNNYDGLVNKYLSTFINGAINYKGKYTLSGSARRDASNLFGVATNDLWNPLWSIGASWLISEEDFLKTKFLPYARLRLTYGSSGNSDSKNAAFTTISYTGTNAYTRTQYAGFSNYTNPNLKWETVNTFNLGADLRWFNNRLSASFDYYVKKSLDLIGGDPIDYTGGVGFKINRNAAEISARGFDMEINSINTNGALKWTTSLFMNLYKDRVDKYYLTSAAASTFVNGNNTINGNIGLPVYAIYAYKWAGLNPQNGNPRGYVNGEISEDYTTITGAKATIADLTYFGTAFPKLTGAIGNSLKWNGFNLDFRITYKFGYYFRREGIDYTSLYSARKGNEEYSHRWQQPGDEQNTSVPSAIYPSVSNRDNFYNFSEATILKGDHIRLQNIGLGYVFSKQAIKQLSFQNITLRIVANNLGILWRSNTYRLDPDYPMAEPTKTFSFNLQFNL